MDQTVVRVAEQLGFQAARLWPQIVMVTWVTSLFWAILDPIIAVAAAVGIGLMVRRTLTEIRDQQAAYVKAVADQRTHYVSRLDYDASGWMVVCAVVCVVLCVTVMAVVTSFPDYLAGAIYPEAATVLRIAKGLK